MKNNKNKDDFWMGDRGPLNWILVYLGIILGLFIMFALFSIIWP